MTDIMDGIIFYGRLWIKQLLEIWSQDFWQYLVESGVVRANQTKLWWDRLVLVSLFLDRLVAVEVHVDDGIASITSLNAVNVI